MASPYTQYVNAIAMRESGLRNQASALSNMSSSLADVSAQTGASSPINASEVPSIAGLANMKAGVGELSTIREKQEKKQIKSLPKYVSAYRNYLQWRYPTRYGGGGGGSAPVSNPYGDYDVPPLPGITGRPTGP